MFLWGDLSVNVKQALARGAWRVVQTAIIVLISVVLMLCALEFWARMQPRRYFVEFDSVLGFKNKPGTSGVYRGRWFLATNPHIDAEVNINALGIRGPARTAEKPTATRRVMVLGDSFVQAFEVPWEETFASKLEERAKITSKPAPNPLEVFPMGVNGYGQAQQLLWLKRDGLRWDPDFVLLVLFLGNDITDNSQDIGSGVSRPYFSLADGELQQVAHPNESARLKYWIADHLRAYLLFRELAVRFEGFRALASRLGWVNSAQSSDSRDPKAVDRLTAAWTLTFALIEEIAKESRAAGAGFGIAFHGTYPTRTSESDRERMSHFCRESGLECLDLSEELEKDVANFIPEDGHWTAQGHARVAKMIWNRWGAGLVGEPN